MYLLLLCLILSLQASSAWVRCGSSDDICMNRISVYNSDSCPTGMPPQPGDSRGDGLRDYFKPRGPDCIQFEGGTIEYTWKLNNCSQEKSVVDFSKTTVTFYRHSDPSERQPIEGCCNVPIRDKICRPIKSNCPEYLYPSLSLGSNYITVRRPVNNLRNCQTPFKQPTCKLIRLLEGKFLQISDYDLKITDAKECVGDSFGTNGQSYVTQQWEVLSRTYYFTMSKDDVRKSGQFVDVITVKGEHRRVFKMPDFERSQNDNTTVVFMKKREYATVRQRVPVIGLAGGLLPSTSNDSQCHVVFQDELTVLCFDYNITTTGDYSSEVMVTDAMQLEKLNLIVVVVVPFVALVLLVALACLMVWKCTKCSSRMKARHEKIIKQVEKISTVQNDRESAWVEEREVPADIFANNDVDFTSRDSKSLPSDVSSTTDRREIEVCKAKEANEEDGASLTAVNDSYLRKDAALLSLGVSRTIYQPSTPENCDISGRILPGIQVQNEFVGARSGFTTGQENTVSPASSGGYMSKDTLSLTSDKQDRRFENIGYISKDTLSLTSPSEQDRSLEKDGGKFHEPLLQIETSQQVRTDESSPVLCVQDVAPDIPNEEDKESSPLVSSTFSRSSENQFKNGSDNVGWSAESNLAFDQNREGNYHPVTAFA